MLRHYILRNHHYKEEYRKEVGISQQVCVFLEHIHNKEVSYYETSIENGILIQGETLYTNVPLQWTERVIFYVCDDELALKLANRWCKENTNEEHIYKAIGVDDYYSPLD